VKFDVVLVGSSRDKLDGEWEWGIQAKRAIRCEVRAEVGLSGLFNNETRAFAPALVDQLIASRFVSVLTKTLPLVLDDC